MVGVRSCHINLSTCRHSLIAFSGILGVFLAQTCSKHSRSSEKTGMSADDVSSLATAQEGARTQRCRAPDPALIPQNKGGGPHGGGTKVLATEKMDQREASAGQKRDGRHDATPRATSRNGPEYRDVRQHVNDAPMQQGLQGQAAQDQGQVQPPQHVQYPPGYAYGSSGQLPYTGQTQWSSGELPQSGMGHGNMQVVLPR